MVKEVYMNHNFKRKEEKFLLDRTTGNQIKKIAKESLSYSEFNSDGVLTDIRTTYLESDDHYIYHLKKTKKKKRFKIRFREYGQNGTFNDTVWVELKEKVKGQGYKNRFIMNKKDVKNFLKGEDVLFSIARLNSKIDFNYLTVLYKTMQKLINKHSLKPLLVVQYRRLAFQNGLKGGIRITFDQDLISGTTGINQLFSSPQNPIKYSEDMLITELKTNVTYPELINNTKKYYGLKNQSFSKFMFGMTSQNFIINEAPFSVENIYKPMMEVVKQEMEYCV